MSALNVTQTKVANDERWNVCFKNLTTDFSSFHSFIHSFSLFL